MRGKAGPNSAHNMASGITPAYAGKSPARGLVAAAVWDHPRVCGEKPGPGLLGPLCPGSPPRMRGKARVAFAWRHANRITPAYAGKRYVIIFKSRTFWDHPRVCGEKIPPRIALLGLQGSPPRMRGKDRVSGAFDLTSGITPAYAGKRLKRSHSIGHFSCILCLFHSVLHRASVSDGSRAGPCAPPCLPAQNAVPV